MFQNLKIKTKLSIAFLLMSSIAFITNGVISVRVSNTALSTLAFSKLESLREVKKTHIERFFKERERNMGALLETVALFEQSAFEKMQSVQQEKKAQVEDYVQQWHDDIAILSTTGSLQNMGNFEILLDGKGGVKLATLDMYEKQYLGDSLKQYVQKYHYADVLLITEHGNIVYSASRGSDLGQNVLDGPLQHTSLASCFQKGMQGVTVQDFTPYPTPESPNSAFIAAPVKSLLMRPIGVVVLKIDSQRLNTIVQRREGMGRTGETYLVGRHKEEVRLLSDQVVRNGKMGDLIEDDEVEKILSGSDGAVIRIGHDGDMEITRYDPVNLQELQWGMVTTMNLEEAIAPALADETDDYFTRFIDQYGYSDLFLIHPDGTVFYSVNHRADYGSNLIDGPYASTGLGKAFRKTKDSQVFSFSDFQPYAPLDGRPVAFMAQPVMSDEATEEREIELVVAVQIPIDEINAIMQERSGMGETGETYLVGPDMLMRSDSYTVPDQYSVTASFSNPEAGTVDTRASREALDGHTDKAIITNYANNAVLSAYTPLDVRNTRWALIAEMSTDEAFASAHRLTLLMRNVAIVGFVIIAVFSFIVSGYITRPIHFLVQLAEKVSEGDLSVIFQEKHFGRDEIGILARAFQNVVTYFREMAEIATSIAKGDLRKEVVPKSDRDTLGQALEQMIAYLHEMATVATAFAEGDLRQEVSPRSDFDVLGKAFYSMKTLRELVQQIIESAQQLGLSADQLTRISDMMAAGSEQTSHQVHAVSVNNQHMNQNINSVSTAAEEYAASIRGVSHNIKEVAHLITVAVEATQATATTITDLESRSMEIGEISKVITSITQQTNLLALNATIEAARAGEVGRGFVVVANEVKNLANETAISAEDITRLIETIRSSVREAKDAITHVLEIVHQVNDLSNSITTAVGQQASTTKEISQNIMDIATGSDEITRSMNEVTGAANHSSENAGNVQKAAGELAALAEQLRQVVAQFKI